MIGYVVDLYYLTFSIMLTDWLCWSFFVLCPFYFWSLYCLSYDLRLLITLFVSSNLSYVRTRHWIVIWIHKLYVSRYELHIPSKEYTRIKKDSILSPCFRTKYINQETKQCKMWNNILFKCWKLGKTIVLLFPFSV